MKIFLVTDVEGVAGVLDFENYCTNESMYYDKAKRLLTGEINACIDGFFAGGATEVRVCDGHGYGAIDPELTPTLYRLANEGIIFNNYYNVFCWRF